MREALLEHGRSAYRRTNVIEGYDDPVLVGGDVRCPQPTASTRVVVRGAIDAAQVLRERFTTVSYTR